MEQPTTIEEVLMQLTGGKLAQEGNYIQGALATIEQLVLGAIDGTEIDIAATEKHIESTGITGDELERAILSARIDHDDRHDTLNDARQALSRLLRGKE